MIRKIVGGMLLSIPFVTAFAVIAREGGALSALLIFSASAVMTGVVLIGTWLLAD